MAMLIFGVLLWSGVHFVSSVGLPLKRRLIGSLGENGYKSVYSVALLVSIALMVFGWRSINPDHLWYLGEGARYATILLVLLAIILIQGMHYRAWFKQFLRHPMLLGTAVWAGAHLLVNGDSRSLVLFGGIGLWALIEIPVINARDGAWEKSAIAPASTQALHLGISLAIFVVLYLLHPYFAGVPVIPA